MNTRKSISHEHAIELLPWLVNGSMDDAEQREVREHALACVICRRELQALELLSSHFANSTESEHIPAPDMRNINARIDELIGRKNRMQELMSWLHDLSTRPWRVAFAVQTALLIALATVLIWPESQEPEFTTLTQPQSIPEGPHVRVVFNPDMAISDFASLLDEMMLTVAGGPSARGVYTLSVPGTMSEHDRAQLLAKLQQEPNVLFAQWVRQRDNQ